MKKIICSIAFYFAATSAMFLILNTTSLYYKFVGLMIIFCLLNFMKVIGMKAMKEILGINWLQKKFKNNCVIMDMTKE